MPSLIAWIPAFIAAVLLAIAVVVWLNARGMSRQRRLPKEWALSPRPVFNTDERRLYRQLREALPHHVVLAKLPLVRFCHPIDPRQVRYWYDLLGGAHVAFAICSASGRVLAAVDIENDRSGTRRGRQVKQAVLDACRVRYLRCAPGTMPSATELQGLLPLPVLNTAMPPPAAAQSPVDRTRERLSNTVASRRQQRQNAHWPDSAFADSQFKESSFVESHYSSLLPQAEPLEGGGVVVENPKLPPVRH
jgi:Protein of unknown function (DUF2726)